MIAEKPSWIRHEGMQIFSIDVQPGGLRLATGGGDHKACVCVSSYFGFVVSNFFFFFCDALEKFANGHSRNFEHYEYFRCPGGFNDNFVFRVMAFEVDSEIYVF